jgi:hypothetical protein
VSIDPINPTSHFDAAQRLSRRVSSGEGELGGAVSSVVAARDPYAQMRATPLTGAESVKPGDPGASVRGEISPSVERGKQSASMQLAKADGHVRQGTATDRAENIGQATIEQFENNVVRKQRLEGALDIRQATSGRLGALHLAEQRPDAASVSLVLAGSQAAAAAAGPATRRVEAVQASNSGRSYGQGAAAAKYRRAAKGPNTSSILAGSPSLDAKDDFDTVAGVTIPRVGILK